MDSYVYVLAGTNKLNLPAGQLTPIGTSATIGNGEDSKKLLCKYASDVFGEEFTSDSIIEKTRIEVDDFLDVKETSLPINAQLKKLSIDSFILLSAKKIKYSYILLIYRHFKYICYIGACLFTQYKIDRKGSQNVIESSYMSSKQTI